MKLLFPPYVTLQTRKIFFPIYIALFNKMSSWEASQVFRTVFMRQKRLNH